MMMDVNVGVRLNSLRHLRITTERQWCSDNRCYQHREKHWRHDGWTLLLHRNILQGATNSQSLMCQKMTPPLKDTP